jgi:hypothetical protein
MWKNMVERGRAQMAIWRKRIACWVSKAADTHSEYELRTVFRRQQWLGERSSILRYMKAYIPCIVNPHPSMKQKSPELCPDTLPFWVSVRVAACLCRIALVRVCCIFLKILRIACVSQDGLCSYSNNEQNCRKLFELGCAFEGCCQQNTFVTVAVQGVQKLKEH